MGPGSWLALGRACGLALVNAALDPAAGGGRAIAKQLERAVHSKNEALARAMLAQLQRQHRELYEEIVRELGEDWA